MKERLEIFKKSTFYQICIHPLLGIFLPRQKDVSLGVSHHKGVQEIEKNGLQATNDFKLGDARIIETIKK